MMQNNWASNIYQDLKIGHKTNFQGISRFQNDLLVSFLTNSSQIVCFSSLIRVFKFSCQIKEKSCRFHQEGQKNCETHHCQSKIELFQHPALATQTILAKTWDSLRYPQGQSICYSLSPSSNQPRLMNKFSKRYLNNQVNLAYFINVMNLLAKATICFRPVSSWTLKYSRKYRVWIMDWIIKFLTQSHAKLDGILEIFNTSGIKYTK